MMPTAVRYQTRTNAPRSIVWARASGLLVDEWLFERAAPVDLAEHVVCLWRGDVGEASILLPDECVDMYWVDGSVWVSGPETRSWPSAARTGTNSIGVCFRSGVASSLLGVAASELVDKRVRLDELWGDWAARELADRISSRHDDDGRAIEIENAVRRMVAGAWDLDVLAMEVAETMSMARTTSVRELARNAQLSERQLHRRCRAAFGYGPAFLLRINRVQRFVQLARDVVQAPRLADLADAAGYTDQAHLAHDVRSIMGTTPAQVLFTPSGTSDWFTAASRRR